MNEQKNDEQKIENEKERYQRLITAFLEVEKELDALKKEGLSLKHQILKNIDEGKKKKVMNFISKI